MNWVLGIHYGDYKVDKLNLATPFNIIIKDIKDKLKNKNIEYIKIIDNKISSYIESKEDGKVRE